MKIADIKLMTASPQIRREVQWKYLVEHLEDQVRKYDLQIDPDFQRGRVWSEEQKSKYVEYCLKGGAYHRDILLNHPGWMKSFEGEFVLVDGLQRLTAITQFIKNKLPVFGGVYLNHFDHPRKLLGGQISFFCINTLKTRKEVLQWYLDLNTGGVVHTNEEIERVRGLLKQES
jgi:hypothetical protein